MYKEQLKYLIAIQQIPGIGSITAKKLIAYCGGVDAVFKEKKQNIAKIEGIGSNLTKSILENRNNALYIAEKELDFIKKNNISAYIYTEKNYPYRLQVCDDSPIVFFSKGDVDFNHDKVISIVGTRNCTTYGTELCELLVEEISKKHNPIVVSGLAYGIDVCAHKSALKNKLKTVAVMGTGLNMIYPAQHRSIAKQILQQGALVSDFTSQAKLDPSNFLRRNRIIAGLSDATIIVESGETGGALVTADIAVSYNRDVLAFPGRVGDISSKGCNKIIKTNKAALIENVDDLEYALGWTSNKNTPKQMQLFDTLNDKEMKIVDYLKKNGNDNIDNISRETQIPMSQLLAMLLTLEFEGYIKSMPGKVYELKQTLK